MSSEAQQCIILNIYGFNPFYPPDFKLFIAFLLVQKFTLHAWKFHMIHIASYICFLTLKYSWKKKLILIFRYSCHIQTCLPNFPLVLRPM